MKTLIKITIATSLAIIGLLIRVFDGRDMIYLVHWPSYLLQVVISHTDVIMSSSL